MSTLHCSIVNVIKIKQKQRREQEKKNARCFFKKKTLQALSVLIAVAATCLRRRPVLLATMRPTSCPGGASRRTVLAWPIGQWLSPFKKNRNREKRAKKKIMPPNPSSSLMEINELSKKKTGGRVQMVSTHKRVA